MGEARNVHKISVET